MCICESHQYSISRAREELGRRKEGGWADTGLETEVLTRDSLIKSDPRLDGNQHLTGEINRGLIVQFRTRLGKALRYGLN